MATERAGDQTRAPVHSLGDFLAVDDTDTSYRVDRLLPIGGRAVLVAPGKGGKTTARDNLTRCLVDGEPFLDTFTVTQAERVVLIDDELDERTLRRWLREQSIRNQDAVQVLSLRGRVASFDLLEQ
ncbi:hypothetical protein BH18ACT8_BH18ACT8_16310 [soil metagenome]